MTDTEQLKRSGGVAVTDLRVTFEAGVAVEVEASGKRWAPAAGLSFPAPVSGTFGVSTRSTDFDRSDA